jgi:hypothetical protein
MLADNKRSAEHINPKQSIQPVLEEKSLVKSNIKWSVVLILM